MRSITGVRVVLPGSAVGFRGMQSSAEPGIKGFEYSLRAFLDAPT